MPLPPALLARLQRRGIVTNDKRNFDHEEVIAEDYDDPNKPGANVQECILAKGYVCTGCPNKSSIYHCCNEYCLKRWGQGKPTPTVSTQRKYAKLVKRYPLPEGWQDVYDPGVGCYYFWNTVTDDVCWLPPHHPEARISVAAEKLRVLLKEEEKAGSDNTDNSDDETTTSSSDSDSGSEESDRNISRKDNLVKFDPPRHVKKVRETHLISSRNRNRERVKNNDLDPMDPASYSEVPRGRWSDGLEMQGDAKTGADATASGPLYQMRPYPNPGAVLRMNDKDCANSDSE